MAIGDVTFYPNYLHHAGFSPTAEPSINGETYTCSGGETTGAAYDLLDNKRTSVVTLDTNGETSTPNIDVDTTENITLFDFAILDNHNLKTCDATASVGITGIHAYTGTLGTELTSDSLVSDNITISHDDLLLITIDSPSYTGASFTVDFTSLSGAYDADMEFGEIAVGVSFTPSIAPDINIVENQSYEGVTVIRSKGGQKYGFETFGERKSWSLTWSYMTNADKESFQTVYEVTKGPKIPFWIDLGEATNPKLYYVRFVQNSLSVRQLTANAFEISVIIESEV